MTEKKDSPRRLKEDALKTAQQALRPFTTGGTFMVSDITYDEKAFGNMLILIRTNIDGVNIRFSRDRDQILSEIQSPEGEWFWLPDLFVVVGLTPLPISKDLGKGLSEGMTEVKRNWLLMCEALDQTHLADTSSKIRKMKQERAFAIRRQ